MASIRRKFTHFVGFLVGGLGICSTALLLSDPMFDGEDISLFSMNSKALAARSLASVESEQNATTKSDAIFSFNCQEPNQNWETPNLRIRIKGQACADQESDKFSAQIKNTSNGYVATVFHPSKNSFTTDYINLNEGSNKILVQFETNSGGVVEKQVVVVRSPASNKTIKR